MSSFGNGDDLAKRALQARLRQGRRGGSSHEFMRQLFLKKAVVEPLLQEDDHTPEVEPQGDWEILISAMDNDIRILQDCSHNVSDVASMFSVSASSLPVSPANVELMVDPISRLPSGKTVHVKAAGYIDQDGSLDFVYDDPAKEMG